MTDLRALCARMAAELDHCHQLLSDDRRALHPLAVEARAALAQPEPEVVASDEELLKVAEQAAHIDDIFDSLEECYPLELTPVDILEICRAVLSRWGRPALAQPEPEDDVALLRATLAATAAQRRAEDDARAALAQPEPEVVEPSDEDLDLLVIAIQALRPEPSPNSHDLATVDRGREILRAWLSRHGRPAPAPAGERQAAPVPVAVSERLPGPEDCVSNPRNGQGEWCWGWVQHDPVPYSGRWRMMRRQWLADEAVAWLPAHALPLPNGEVA